MVKKYCTRCGIFTYAWMEVNQGQAICYDCNRELIEAEKLEKQRKQEREGKRSA